MRASIVADKDNIILATNSMTICATVQSFAVAIAIKIFKPKLIMASLMVSGLWFGRVY